MSPWTYPPEFLEALGALGLRPHAGTPPALVRGALNDLYRFEIRRLRDRRRTGEVAAEDYIDLVIVLRKKYWLLSLQLPAWERITQETGPA